MLQHASSKSFLRDSLPVTDFILIHSHIRQFASMMFLSNHPSSMLRMVAVLHYFVTYEKPLSFIGDKPSYQLLQSFFQATVFSQFMFSFENTLFPRISKPYPSIPLLYSFLRLDRQNSFSLFPPKGTLWKRTPPFPASTQWLRSFTIPSFWIIQMRWWMGKMGSSWTWTPCTHQQLGQFLVYGWDTARPVVVTVVAIGFQYRLIGMKIAVQNPFLFFLKEHCINRRKTIGYIFFSFLLVSFSFLKYLYTLHETNIAPGNGWLDT